MDRPPHLIAALGFVAVLATVLLVSGSSSARPSAVAAAPAPASPKLAYADRGPRAVGYRVFTTTDAQHRRLTLRAWYPTSRSAAAPASITYTAPNKFDEQLTPGAVITSEGRAIRNARPRRHGGPYPLVVLSHGYGLSPIVYSSLAEHYASRGFLVLGPEHHETFDGSLTGFWKALVDRPADIRRTIDHAERLNRPRAPFAGLVDLDHVAVVGHSYGGYTTLAAGGARFDFDAYRARCAALAADDPLTFFCDPVLPHEADMAAPAGLPEVPSGLWPSLGDPRVTAVVSMAGDAYPFDERGLQELTVPVMAMGGTVDDGTPYTWGAKLTYDHAGSDSKSLVGFPGAGHMIFLDTCDHLPWTQESVWRDAFCADAVWDERPLDVVAHYTTAFLRDTLDDDPRARAVLAGEQPALTDVEYATNRQP